MIIVMADNQIDELLRQLANVRVAVKGLSVATLNDAVFLFEHPNDEIVDLRAMDYHHLMERYNQIKSELLLLSENQVHQNLVMSLSSYFDDNFGHIWSVLSKLLPTASCDETEVSNVKSNVNSNDNATSSSSSDMKPVRSQKRKNPFRKSQLKFVGKRGEFRGTLSSSSDEEPPFPSLRSVVIPLNRYANNPVAVETIPETTRSPSPESGARALSPNVASSSTKPPSTAEYVGPPRGCGRARAIVPIHPFGMPEYHVPPRETIKTVVLNQRNRRGRFVRRRIPICSLCSLEHFTVRCPPLVAASPIHRNAMISEAGLCIKCLRPDHPTGIQCLFGDCKICDEPHNTMLHVDESQPGPSNPGHRRSYMSHNSE